MTVTHGSLGTVGESSGKQGKAHGAGVCADCLTSGGDALPCPALKGSHRRVGLGPHRLPPLSLGRRCSGRCDPLCGEQTGCCQTALPREVGRT